MPESDGTIPVDVHGRARGARPPSNLRTHFATDNLRSYPSYRALPSAVLVVHPAKGLGPEGAGTVSSLFEPRGEGKSAPGLFGLPGSGQAPCRPPSRPVGVSTNATPPWDLPWTGGTRPSTSERCHPAPVPRTAGPTKAAGGDGGGDCCDVNFARRRRRPPRRRGARPRRPRLRAPLAVP